MINKIIQKMVCLMLIATQAVWAAPLPAVSFAPMGEVPSAFFQIEIPEDLATVEEVYEAPASQDPKVVLHIQNVHGNYQAQVQVKKMLDYFYKNYGFKIIFCEGAAEKLDSKYLELFPEHSDNLALADDLAKKGQLTGPELYLMDAPKDVQAIGIEQTDLYRGNFDAFKTVYKSKKSTDSFIKLLDSRLELLSSRFLTRDMRRILSEWQKFHEGRREFMPFVKHLAEESQKFLNLDLNSLFAQVEWPQTARLLVLQSMEADLKQDEAMAERAKLITFLKEQKASDTLITGLEKMEEKTISLQRLARGKGEDPFLPRKLLERLAEEASPMGFQFHQYPNFSLYAGYTILESELDSKVLFQEIEKLFDRILESLTVSEKEKNVLELYKDLELLKKLVALELTRPEWDQATYRKNWIKPQSLVDRLDKMSSSGFVTENLVVTKEIPGVFSAAFDFYDFARQREFAFYETIEQEMSAQKADRAILVTGGFHTDGLSDIFRSKQVNYGILTPRMGGDFEKANYIQTMMETHPTLFDLAQMEIVETLGRSEVRRQLGMQSEMPVISAYMARFDQVVKRTIKERDRTALKKLLEAANPALESRFGGNKLAGFKEIPGKENAFNIMVVDQEHPEPRPLTNKKGFPIVITLNPLFLKGQAIVLSADKSHPAAPAVTTSKKPAAVASKAAKTTILGDKLVATTGRFLGDRSSLIQDRQLEMPDFSEIFSSDRPQFTEAQLARTALSLFPKADEFLADKQYVLAVQSLSASGFSLASLEQILSRLEQQNKKTGSVTLGNVAERLAKENVISEPHARIIQKLSSKVSLPGAVILRLTVPLDQKGYGSLVEHLLIRHSLNPMLYIAVVVPESTTPKEFEELQDLFAPVVSASEGRFSLENPSKITPTQFPNTMVDKMRRRGDVKADSLLNLTKKYLALSYDESEGTPEEWIPYGSTRVLHEASSKTREFNAYYAMLNEMLAELIIALEAEEIDEDVLSLLEILEDEDKAFGFTDEAYGLARSLKKVLTEYLRERDVDKSA